MPNTKQPEQNKEWGEEYSKFWDYITNSDNWYKGRAKWNGVAYLTLGNCIEAFIENLLKEQLNKVKKECYGEMREMIHARPCDYLANDFIEEMKKKLKIKEKEL